MKCSMRLLTAILPIIFVIVIVIIYLRISVILGILLTLLFIVSVLSVMFARAIIHVKIRVQPVDSSVTVSSQLNEVDVELDAGNNYSADVEFIRFFAGQTLKLTHGTQQHYYDQECKIFLRIERGLFGFIRCSIWNEQGSAVLKQYLRFYASPLQRHNKVVSAGVSAAVIITAVVLCALLNSRYTQSREMIQNNLQHNIEAVASGQPIVLDPEPISDTPLYYEELPAVHLIVITKEEDKFTDPDGAFIDPTKLNTVLMLYEDNLTGQRYVRTQNESVQETDAETISEQSCYNLTELYLNIPLMLEDYENATLGQLFSGEISYMGEQGYNAVCTWFRDTYHVQIASVTEIPISVFSDCYGTENAMAVNINTYFLRFWYGQYCEPAGNTNESPGVRDMLAESHPVFPEALQDNAKELSLRLDIHNKNSASHSTLLMMNGPSIAAFGNTVRMIGDDDSELMHAAQDEENTQNSLFLNSIVHSNWDIVLTSLFDGMGNLNNGTYMVFCSENHADTLSRIRTSLPPEELRSFLYRLLKANKTLGDESDQQKKCIFYVRNLDLHVNSVLGKPNAYLQSEPLSIHPYTNRLVKISLYYCLREEKAQ